MNNNISVIVRVRNEERWIGHTIQSIIDHLPGSEIIVINNESEDESIQIVKHFITDTNLKNNDLLRYADIKIFDIKDYTPGKSINLGVSKSSRKYNLVISSHCIINKINIESLIKDLQNYKSIFGKQIPVWNGKKIIPRYIWSHFKNNKVENMYSELEKRYFHHNAIAIYERDFLIKNPFDENLQSKEDRYWAENIINNNYKILYDPSLEVYHHYTANGNTWKGLA